MTEMGFVLLWVSAVAAILLSGIGGILWAAIHAWTTWRPHQLGLFVLGCVAGGLGTIIMLLWAAHDWTQRVP